MVITTTIAIIKFRTILVLVIQFIIVATVILQKYAFRFYLNQFTHFSKTDWIAIN